MNVQNNENKQMEEHKRTNKQTKERDLLNEQNKQLNQRRQTIKERICLGAVVDRNACQLPVLIKQMSLREQLKLRVCRERECDSCANHL